MSDAISRDTQNDSETTTEEESSTEDPSLDQETSLMETGVGDEDEDEGTQHMPPPPRSS